MADSKGGIASGSLTLNTSGAALSGKLDGLRGGENFYELGKASGNISSGYLPVYMQDQVSGVYQVDHTIALKKISTRDFVGTNIGIGGYFGSGNTYAETRAVVNRSSSKYGNADFGSGWSLVGLQELLITPKGKANAEPLYRDRTQAVKFDPGAALALVDGNGQTIVYRSALNHNGVVTYSGPPGDFSKVEHRADGNYYRTTKDQTVSVFDAWGLLISMTDRNNNKTTYEYNERGHLIKITDPVGLAVTFELEDDQVKSVTAPGDNKNFYRCPIGCRSFWHWSGLRWDSSNRNMMP